MSSPLISDRLRRWAEARFRTQCRVNARRSRQPLRRKDIDLQVASLYLAFQDEMRQKPDELKKLELEVRGLVAPGPMIQSIKEHGREQLRQRAATEARKIQVVSR